MRRARVLYFGGAVLIAIAGYLITARTSLHAQQRASVQVGANDIGGGRQSSIGDRILAYGAVSIPFGRSHLALYGWEMRRLRARNFDAPATLAVPRGNVLALGARLERALTPRATLVPTLEFRHELTGPTARMELLGFLVRTGTDLRYQISSSTTGVIQASLAFGTLQDQGTKVSILGRRLGALIEWSR